MQMFEIAAALESVKVVDDALSVIGNLISKLKAKPDLAVLKLADALDEVRKTYQVLDQAIIDYLSLGFDHNAIKSGSKTLLKIEGGGLLVDVEKGRGHCHVIGNIYKEFLDRWFERALNQKDLSLMRKVFESLSEADIDVFYYLVEVAKQLQAAAAGVLKKILKCEVEQARKIVLSSRKELKPLRIGMSNTMQKLYELKGEFIKISDYV
jgi:hypothetical protein